MASRVHHLSERNKRGPSQPQQKGQVQVFKTANIVHAAGLNNRMLTSQLPDQIIRDMKSISLVVQCCTTKEMDFISLAKTFFAKANVC